MYYVYLFRIIAIAGVQLEGVGSRQRSADRPLSTLLLLLLLLLPPPPPPPPGPLGATFGCCRRDDCRRSARETACWLSSTTLRGLSSSSSLS